MAKPLIVHACRVLATLGALAPLASLAHAQRRAPLLGVVRDAAGAAVAGAAVTVIEDDPDLAGVDAIDALEATTDARGRFKVDALCGVRYCAVAVGPEANGSAFVARPVYGLACGRAAELTLTIAGRTRDVAMPGLAAWGPRDGLRARFAVPDGSGHFVPLQLRDGPAIAVTALAAIGNPQLCDRDGAFLAPMFVPLAVGQTATVSPPNTIDVVVVDAEGKPVAGACVRAQREHTVEAGAWVPVRHVARDGPAITTGANGRAAVPRAGWRSPGEGGQTSLTVIATGADGRHGTSGWTCEEAFADGRVLEEHPDGVVRVTLANAVARKAAGAGVVGRTMRAFVTGLARQQREGAVASYWVRRVHDAAIGADGTFALPVVPEQTGTTTVVTPPIGGRRVLWLPGRNGALPELDLATCEPLSLRIVDGSGGPAIGANVLFVPADCDAIDLEHAPSLVPDPAGRVDVLLQRGRWTLLAADATHWGSLDLTEGANAPATLVLEPKPSARVRVVDAAGKPVAGARFEPEEFGTRHRPQPGLDAALVALGWNMFAIQVRGVTTDANGDATLLWLPCPGAQPKVSAFVDDYRRRSDAAPITAGGELVVLKLQR
ncbi:MAG TPA: hypothetical protein VF384_10205 [Planctomycetota bacterium]